MDRLTRLESFWSWLPVFRVVAETEHLPTAARLLKVSASSLSRTIRLLEEALGQELFFREGRRLRLSQRGDEFLAAVRDAMRRVDEGRARLEGEELRGQIHFSLAGPYYSVLASAIEHLRAQHPGLLPFSHNYVPGALESRLLRGELDLVVTPDPPAGERLLIEALCDVTSSIYCGPTHPLARARKLSLERVLGHEFAAPILSESSPYADGWPPGIDRRVVTYVQQLPVAFELCSSGQCLATFPDIVVRSNAAGRRLRRLPLEIVPPKTLWSVRRPPIGEHRDVEALLESIRTTIAALAPEAAG